MPTYYPPRTQPITGDVTAMLAAGFQLDAFGRLRTSEPRTLFDGKLLADKQPLIWSEEIFATATSAHQSGDAAVRMSTSASGDAVIRQTFQRFNYQPGKSQLCFLTFRATAEANVRKRVGYYRTSNAANSAPQDGVYYEVNGTTDIAWAICKGGTVTERIVRASWNLDPLDGTGASGVTLDTAATLIAFMDLEWLGVGTVRVGFVIDGVPIYVHAFHHANDSSFTSVYTATANLPVGYAIYQSGAGSGSLDQICSSVISEGGRDPIGVFRVSEQGTSQINANTTGTWYAMVGVRLKTTNL